MYKGPAGAVAGPDTRHGPDPHLMGVETLVGNDVFNDASVDLGDIQKIMLDMRNGQVSYAVLSFGGFLGMGESIPASGAPASGLGAVRSRRERKFHLPRIAPSAPQRLGASPQAGPLLLLLAAHSHSIVAGGFPEMSYTTRLSPRTSLMMRFDTRPSRS